MKIDAISRLLFVRYRYLSDIEVKEPKPSFSSIIVSDLGTSLSHIDFQIDRHLRELRGDT